MPFLQLADKVSPDNSESFKSDVRFAYWVDRLVVATGCCSEYKLLSAQITGIEIRVCAVSPTHVRNATSWNPVAALYPPIAMSWWLGKGSQK